MNSLKVYTEEEIEMFLKGDRREVDKLLLVGINNINHTLSSHVGEETPYFHEMGTITEVRARTIWIDAQIKKQEKRNLMMDKVAESTTLWALPLFMLILFIWFGDVILDTARHALAKKIS